jgi:hypothetical protein
VLFLRDEPLASGTIECPLELRDLGFQFINLVIEFQNQFVAFRHSLRKFSSSFGHPV